MFGLVLGTKKLFFINIPAETIVINGLYKIKFFTLINN